MKKILSAFIILLSACAAHAQKPVFGIKAGLNIANLTDSAYDFGSGTMDPGVRAGVNAGLWGEFSFNSRWGAGLEATYSQQGNRYVSEGWIRSVRNDYVNVPLLAKLYLKEWLALEAGPQVGFLVNSQHVYNNGEVIRIWDTEEFYYTEDLRQISRRDVDFSIAMGACASYKGKRLWVRYCLGLTGFSPDMPDNKMRNSVIQISLGQKF